MPSGLRRLYSYFEWTTVLCFFQALIATTQEQSEAFESSAGAIISSVSSAKARMNEVRQQQEAQKKEAEETQAKAINDYWTNAFPYYHYAVVSLRDILMEELHNSQRADGVEQPLGYLQCLPTNWTLELESSMIGRKLTDIRFQNHTNVIFFITIDGNQDEQRSLRIYCAAGFVQFHPHQDVFWRRFNIPSLGLDLQEKTNFNQAHAFIVDALEVLVVAQEALDETNKSATKTLDNKQ